MLLAAGGGDQERFLLFDQAWVPALHAWPISLGAPGPDYNPWHHNSEIQADLAAISERVRPKDALIVLPPRQAAPHFILGTHPPRAFEQGYGWMPDPDGLFAALASPDLRFVLVMSRFLEQEDRDVWRASNVDRAFSALPERGFQPVLERPTMTLWERR
jgi:hypothetical protein